MRPEIVDWLRRGAAHGNGQMPLFDEWGVKITSVVIEVCLREGFIETWFENPRQTDWVTYRITARGRDYATGANDNEV
jgi:hypothetical protein